MRNGFIRLAGTLVLMIVASLLAARLARGQSVTTAFDKVKGSVVVVRTMETRLLEAAAAVSNCSPRRSTTEPDAFPPPLAERLPLQPDTLRAREPGAVTRPRIRSRPRAPANTQTDGILAQEETSGCGSLARMVETVAGLGQLRQ